jgi:hypothetical protein
MLVPSPVAMDTIEVNGFAYHGVHCGNVGVYTHKCGDTYAGAHEGGKAHGYGVAKYSSGTSGTTYFGQRANGRWHGHYGYHWANGDVDYGLYEHGSVVHTARVRPNGKCEYDGKRCGADHAGLVELKDAGQQAGVRICR